MDTIEYVDRLQDHWWWREGRHFYACHITIDDQPELQRLVGASGVCPPRSVRTFSTYSGGPDGPHALAGGAAPAASLTILPLAA